MFDDLKLAAEPEDEMEDFRDYGDDSDDLDSKLDDYEDGDEDDEDDIIIAIAPPLPGSPLLSPTVTVLEIDVLELTIEAPPVRMPVRSEKKARRSPPGR